MSDVHHRDAILDGLRYGARSAAQLFNGITSCESLPDLMRDLRAMVELRELQVLRLGTTLMYAVSEEAPNAEPAPDPAPETAQESEPGLSAAPPMPEPCVVPKTAAARRRRRDRGNARPPSEKPRLGLPTNPESNASKLVAVVAAHPWCSLAEIIAHIGGATAECETPYRRTAATLHSLVLRNKLQRVGRKHSFRYALPDCTLAPPELIAPLAPARRERDPVCANDPSGTAPSLRHTLDGMLVELNRLGEVRLVSSGHARLNWMCWLMPANGVMVSSSWRNDAREAVADLVARLEQLRGRLLTEPTEPKPDQAPARAA